MTRIGPLRDSRVPPTRTDHLAVDCRCRLIYRLSIASFGPTANIRVPIVSVIGSLNDIERLALNPTLGSEYFSSKDFVPFLLVVRDSPISFF